MQYENVARLKYRELFYARNGMREELSEECTLNSNELLNTDMGLVVSVH